jgi:predicted MFS family arabinose efflux permease
MIAVAYAVAFLQRVSPQTILDVLQRDFSTTAQGVGVLASGYFYGYMIVQIPAGIFVDTFGVRKVMLASLTASAVGTAMFAMSGSVGAAFAARVFIACSDALVFTGLIKLVAQSFPDRRFGVMSGLSQVSGYVGGILAATPLALAVSAFGWRSCFSVIALITAGNLIALYGVMPHPPVAPMVVAGVASLGGAIRAALERVWRALKTRETWGCAFTFSSHFVSATSLSGVWGIPMLMHVYGLGRVEASTPMLAFMVATMIGSIGFGLVADRISWLFHMLIASCLVRMILLALMAPALGSTLGVHFVTACLAAFGLVGGGTMPLVFKCLKRIYTSNHIGMGTSINSTLAGVIAGAIQPALGWVLDATRGAAVAEEGAVGSNTGYDVLILFLIAVSFMGILGPIMMRRRIGASASVGSAVE